MTVKSKDVETKFSKVVDEEEELELDYDWAHRVIKPFEVTEFCGRVFDSATLAAKHKEERKQDDSVDVDLSDLEEDDATK